MKRAKMIYKIMSVIVISSMVLVSFGKVASPAKAAALVDGTWAHGATDTVTFTTLGNLSIGDKIVLTFSQEGAVNASPTGCTLDAAALAPVVDATRKTYTWTLTVAKTAGVRTLAGCLMVSTFNPSSYKAHTVGVNTVTAAGVAVDWGVATTYNGTAGGTGVAVSVTATVPQFLNMNLNKTAIDLGVLNTAVVSTDAHTITINTNDTAGYITRIASSGGLVSGSDNIDPKTEGTGVVTAGSEEYGIAVTAGGGATESGNFATDDTPIPVGSTTFITNATAATAHVHTVTYRAAISGTTASGNYTQTVYYTIATN